MRIAPKFSLHLGFCILFIFLFMLPQIVLSRPLEQPFKSFRLLEGCHKGQKVEGLRQLKQYLKRFGYLSYPQLNNSLTHANDDEFEDLLEAAVKSFQLNYNLKVTGTLDSKTVMLLMLPRCGVPDIINGTSSMRSNKLHIGFHFAFFPNMPKWPDNKHDLTYRFRSSAQVIAAQDMRAACSRAFARWAQVTNFKFTEVAEGAAADIEIGFHRRDHGDGNPFDGSHYITAHAFPPTDGRTHFDADETRSINPDKSMMDLESIAVHEFGHVLGLAHTTVEESIMYPVLFYGFIKRDLTKDDIDGIQTLYPK